MSKRLTILLAVVLLYWAAGVAWSADSPVLLEMRKREGLNTTKISLLFDRLPEFSFEHSGQRLDILLAKTKVSDGLVRLPEDETVVKILLARKERDLLTSILLRRLPKQIVSKSQHSPARIDFDLYWDSAPGTRPAVAFRIEGMPGRNEEGRPHTAQHFPPWRDNWRNLFKADLTPWKIDPELSYSLPALPVLAPEHPSAALQKRLDLVAQKRWHSLLRFVAEMPPVAANEVATENLLISEGLLRTGGIEAAAARLRTLGEVRGPLRPRVDYLTDFALAAGGQPYVALIKLDEQRRKLAATDPFAPLMTLLHAETSLATGKDKVAAELLADKKIHWPEALLPLVRMRRGDAACGLDDFAAAFEAYLKVQDETSLFDHYPRSRARAARAAFKTGRYSLAAGLYKDLAGQLADRPLEDLALFAAADASYDAGDAEWAQIGLQKVYLEMPGSEGADRAQLRLQDQQVLIGNERDQAEAAYRYAGVVKNSRFRALREEAAFKQALVLYLIGDTQESVNRLMTFRRSFASGALRDQGDSLLLEQLPTAINGLIARGEDIAAVVLVEQNRKLLLSSELDKAFLDNIAGALTRLGLFKRAARILLYELDRGKTAAGREQYYLPLAQLYLLRQDFRAASDYATTYLDTYPHGAKRGAVYSLMLDALEKQNRKDELLRQVERKDRPQSPALDIRAAWIYWQHERLADVVKRLESARSHGGHLEVKDLALLAESLYQLGRDSESEKLFRQLQDDKTFGPQASYRGGQLLLRRGEKSAGLKLLRHFVEKEKSGPWVLLAQDLLIEIR